MQHTIHFGVPEMEDLWKRLMGGEKSATLGTDEARLLKRLRKALRLLASNPRHPSLQSHEIKPLTTRYGEKVWQSYLENRTPAAGRFYWLYGPARGQITVIGIEPHPEDRKSSYEQVVLSSVQVGGSSARAESRRR